MNFCGGVTDAAFAHLRGIHTLSMSFCNQASITDAAFAYLRGIHTLHMWDCNQATITLVTHGYTKSVAQALSLSLLPPSH